MPSSRQESLRRSKANDVALAKQKQLETFAAPEQGLLTTGAGHPIADNHGSLRAGERGPLLVEDFILREKLARFEHERMPERVVGARGCAAHGYFEATRSMADYTSADLLQQPGTRTPVFVRFSQLTGSQGSADTVPDARGFAVKFYTSEGNWDLVGSSIPVAFVQDAMKFPDFVHALKPEPHHGMPQASSAHDTFWDFATLVPESTHALMWLMSGHALPRSYRMMAGFGVHTFRLLNARGDAHWAKFQWKPRLGRHALLRDEAREIAGCDPDFLRRDLWQAIESGCHPEWELALQLVPEAKAQALGIDLLDPTKLVPEEIVPPLIAGRLVLSRNPQDFFAECEQVAFHPAHLVPGIALTNDPLLQGRVASYTGSQIGRLGGPNFGELPINRPVCPMRTLARDGAHRASIGSSRVAYEPNMLDTGAEFRVDGGQRSQATHETVDERKTRSHPPQFDDHFSQATLFWNSQSPMEKEHIVGALQHDLCKVESAAVRQRAIDNLAHVDARLARKVGDMLGLVPDAKAAAGRSGFRERRHKPLLESAPSLSMDAEQANGIATRRVAVLVAPGVEVGALRVIQQALHEESASCCFVGEHLGSVATASGQQLPVDRTFCTAAGVLFDAVILPGGTASVKALAANPAVKRFVADAYKHGKAICAIGEGAHLLRGLALPDGDEPAQVPGVIVSRGEPPVRVQLARDFIAAIAGRRHGPRPHRGIAA